MANFDNQTIFHIKAGHLPPEALVRHILAWKPTAFGFSIQDKTKEGNPTLSVVKEDAEGINFDELNRLMVNAKDHNLSVYFGKLDKAFDAASIQPFELTDGNNDTFMTLFMEGTVNGNDDPANQTEHHNLVTGLIIPQIEEWCELYEGDLDKIVAKIKAAPFEKVLKSQIGHRGILHIMPLDGELITMGSNNETLSLDADWGFITNRLGFGDKKVEAVAEPSAKKGWWGKKSATTSVPATPVADAATPGTHDRSSTEAKGNAVGGKPAKQETKAPDLAARPPSWLHKNDDVKLWYKIVGGISEANWKKRIPCIVKDFDAVKLDNLDAFKAYALKKTLETTGGTQTSAGKPPAETAKADAKAISGVAGDVELPIIDAKSLEKVLDYAAKHLDNGSKEIPDPKEMQKQETAYALFSTSVGATPSEIANWQVAGLFGIGKTDYRAAVLGWIESRLMVRLLAQRLGHQMDKEFDKYIKELLEASTSGHVKETDKSKTVTTTNGTTTKVESVAKDAPPAPKKNGFWNRKAA